MKASKFTDAQKAFILKQGADGHPVAEICRKAGISEATYFNCKRRLRLAVTHKCRAALRYGPLRRGRRDGRSHAILLPSLAARRKRGRDNPRGVRPP